MIFILLITFVGSNWWLKPLNYFTAAENADYIVTILIR